MYKKYKEAVGARNTSPYRIPGFNPYNWAPENYSALKNWLERWQSRANRTGGVAIFDFDNTCIYGDVGKVIFQYQLRHLRFRLSPGRFAKLFPEHLDELTDRQILLVIQRINELYTLLFHFIALNKREYALEMPEAQEFQVLLTWYCGAARQHEALGPLYSLSFLTKLLAGYSVQEVEDLSYEAIASALFEPVLPRKEVAHYMKDIGQLKVSATDWLRIQPEIIDLMTQLRDVGIRCCIVSASTEWIVKAAAFFFDLPVDQEDIFGIRVTLQQHNDVLSTKLPDDYPVTYGSGKVEVIRNHITESSPVLVAGDAVTDYEMLNLPQVPLRLLINHNRTDRIASLYSDCRFLVQGLNKKTGFFRPHRETLEYDIQESSSLDWKQAAEDPRILVL